jgi:hypothetical protein
VEETTVKRAASEINNNNNNVRVVDMNKVGKEAVVEEQDISVFKFQRFTAVMLLLAKESL